MRMLLLTVVAALAACGNGPGTGTAQWTGVGVDETVHGKAQAGWCAESRTVLLEVSAEDRVAGASWRFDSLAPGEFPLAPPVPADSARVAAAAAARYVHLDEVRGYRALTGTLRVTAVDSTEISATVEGLLQRVGEIDTLQFTARFHRVPLSRDETLCAP